MLLFVCVSLTNVPYGEAQDTVLAEEIYECFQITL